MQALLESVLDGAGLPELDAIEVTALPALEAGPEDVLAADGYLLGTPANFGYMSGALKHFFDLVYHPCLNHTRGRPYGMWLHGANDVTGAVRSVITIVTGLGWSQAAHPVESTGPIEPAVHEACQDLGATLAARLIT
jgi:hypothetical protein